MKPLLEPVLDRLARNEQHLLELKTAMEIQFKRTAELQAQVDRLVTRRARKGGA